MSSRLFIENIGSEDILLAGATAEDLAYVAPFANARRRCEVLAWRAVVRRELGQDVAISYDEYGAPVVDAPNKHISISHSRTHVAVCISDAPCAVDIEQSDRDFRRVASRYLSVGELVMAEAHELFAEMWSAKEALYKLHRRGGLDLIEHIKISDYNPDRHIFVAHILGGEPIEVHVKREGNLVIALVQ